jgi:predicted nucleic acid-binding protein
VTAAYLVDNSAWVRFADPRVPAAVKECLADAVEDLRLWACAVLQLEAGFSATDAASHADLADRLRRLPHADIGETTLQRAVDLQAQLVLRGHHRLPPADLIVVATAEEHGLTVLHYDKDFDLVEQLTDCAAEMEWLVPRGTI